MTEETKPTAEAAQEAAVVPTPAIPAEINEIVRAFSEATYVDNSAIYAAKLERLSGFAVTAENIDEAKKTRAALNGLAKDAGEARMKVQRAIKEHPIGAFAFTKSALEKCIEKESKRLDGDIKRIENAPKVRLNEKIETFVCFVTGTLAQVNKLSVYANEEMGLGFENHGPAEPDEPAASVERAVEADVASVPAPRAPAANAVPEPPPPPSIEDIIGAAKADADEEPLF